MKKSIWIAIALSVSVSSVVIALYFSEVRFLKSFEEKTYDLKFALRGDVLPHEGIAIAAIDEKSIKELGRFPWKTRKPFSDFIDMAAKAGAKVLLFDVFFSERESKRWDSALASSVRRSGITILPVVIDFKEGSVIENLPELQNAAKGISHINMTPDEDGVVRRTPLLLSGPERAYPSLGLIGAMEALGIERPELGDGEIKLGGKSIPVDSELRILINYTGAEGTYKRYSFSDIALGRVGKPELEGKVILVGATAVGIYDLRVTPFSNNTPGVEVNANIIDNILRGDFMRKGRTETVNDLLSTVFLTVVLSFTTLRVRAAFTFPFAVILIAGYSWFSYLMFLNGRWVSTVYPIMGIILSYSATASLRFFMVERKAKKVRAMFSSYVSKKIVDELMKSPEMAKVGGERRVITILFTDVKGYTAFSEKYSPEEVVKVLNEFLSEMTNVIMEYDGTLDKFLGDGILAFWGAPVAQKNHAELAVRSSIEMLRRMERLREKWRREGREPLECGIGINTGEAIVGNIGVEGKKVDYTAIGDSVNLTHRLQDISRIVKRPVLSGDLYDGIKDTVDAEYIGEEQVKGRQQRIKVYALNGLR